MKTAIHSEWKNLAPGLVRQRVIIEAINDHVVTKEEISAYLLELSQVLGMRPLGKPFAYDAEDKGFGGWIHWVTSGAHFYSYTPVLGADKPFFSVDAYTCKPFDVHAAVQFTAEYFNTEEIVYREVEV